MRALEPRRYTAKHMKTVILETLQIWPSLRHDYLQTTRPFPLQTPVSLRRNITHSFSPIRKTSKENDSCPKITACDGMNWVCLFSISWFHYTVPFLLNKLPAASSYVLTSEQAGFQVRNGSGRMTTTEPDNTKGVQQNKTLFEKWRLIYSLYFNAFLELWLLSYLWKLHSYPHFCLDSNSPC